jgi:hypothetical protein
MSTRGTSRVDRIDRTSDDERVSHESGNERVSDKIRTYR